MLVLISVTTVLPVVNSSSVFSIKHVSDVFTAEVKG